MKVAKTLAHKNGSKPVDRIYKRLIMSKRNQSPVSLAFIANLQRKAAAKNASIPCAVVVGTLTACKPMDEAKLVNGMRVAALRITESAREQITSRGGECFTLDEFLLQNPMGGNSTFVRPRTLRREADKYFGKAPGCRKSKTKARCNNPRKERAVNKMFRRK